MHYSAVCSAVPYNYIAVCSEVQHALDCTVQWSGMHVPRVLFDLVINPRNSRSRHKTGHDRDLGTSSELGISNGILGKSI